MSIFTLPRAYGINTDGTLVSGAKINFYDAGTSTPKATYSDSALSVANSNPVVADSNGLFGAIYLGAGLYKVVLTDASDVVLWTQDNVPSINATNLSAVPTSRTLTASTGLSGGGTLAADRSFALDISALTAIDVASVAAADGLLVDDGGVMKRMSIQSSGIRVQAAATQILALDDGNSLIANTGADAFTVTVPPAVDVAFPIGVELGFACASTGTITLAAGAGVTIASLDSLLTVKASGGSASILKLATDTWILIGALE